MKLSELVESVQALAVDGPVDREVTGITYDSRRVMPGHVFVAMRGENTDGHRFIASAIDRGASAVVLERGENVSTKATRIRVADARRAAGVAAARFYDHPSQKLKVVGVTGTNGKTTTAFMTKAILEEAGIAAGLMGTVQYVIGERVIPASRTTPESVDIQDLMSQMLRAGCGGVAMEVSSHALDQQRVSGVDFDVGVFTNLTRDHLDYHKTTENYFGAKKKLFASLGTLQKPGRAVINVDDPRGRELMQSLGGEVAVLTYGHSSDALIRAHDVRISSEGTYFVAHTPQGGLPISLPLIGRYNVSNALAALGAAMALEIDLSVVERALAHLKPVPGRLEKVAVEQEFNVYVDYAHTPDALRNVLATVGELTRGRLIVVFGCGGDRDQGKRAPMGSAACELADLAILTSDNPRTEEPQAILRQVEEGFPAEARSRYQVIEDRREAIERALDMARDGDTVLIAGKGHENYQEFADTVVPFNDRQVVEEYFTMIGQRWKACV